MTVKLYCEGGTEKGLRRLLQPIREELRTRNLGLHIRTYEGVGQLLHKLPSATRDSLSTGARAVFALVDLHGAPVSFPNPRAPARQRADWLREHLRTLIPEQYRNRFYPHVAVHELEAWILADPSGLRERLKTSSLPSWPHPECVNDTTPPSDVLNGLFRARLKIRYAKIKEGVPLLEKLNLDAVYKGCPSFQLFIDDLRRIR
ncbi:MAG: DUF4276 family protein [Chloroflexi bacterium]|nr:DUF4276 family protein [Chloroflexota bacterium]